MKRYTLFYSAVTALAVTAACTKDGITPDYTVGQADNEIVLAAGVAQDAVQTKAGTHVYAPFSAQTQMRLRVDGTWLGHSPVDVTKTTTAKTAAAATVDTDTDGQDDTHSVEFTPSEKLYWDDYGTADPANMPSVAGNGRDKGLTIYGAAVDGTSTLPSELGSSMSWTALSWNIGTPSDGVINQTAGWAAKDLVTSNNVTATPGPDGTYRFDDRASGKLLKFTHAMSKVTVNLTAGEGFPDGKFQNAPKVTLLNFNYQGTVSVEAKTSDPTSGTANIDAYRDNGATWAKANKSQLTALVFPGESFTNAADILKINADDNIYYVTAEKINAAITTAGDANFVAGKNYIFNVTINKTAIKVTATVTDWVNVESDPVAPKINITADWGVPGTGSLALTAFSFYRSLSLNSGYGVTSGDYFDAEAKAVKPGSGTQWPFKTLADVATKLYWPTHSTHYQFRGVWPLTSVLTTDTYTAPHVKTDVNGNQVIPVRNVKYTVDTYPSDLMIARPEFNGADPLCTNADHTKKHLYSEGICATEGMITMNFRYMMSQVEVLLKTVSDPTAAVNIDGNTVVELVNVSNTGDIKLGDRESLPSTTKGNYTLDKIDATEANKLRRLSAIVPQALTYSTAGASTNLRFKITVTNSDSTTDVYYADVNPIKKDGSSDLVAPNGKWERGVHYVYTLTLSKTEIKVKATITDWVTVNASDTVWF